MSRFNQTVAWFSCCGFDEAHPITERTITAESYSKLSTSCAQLDAVVARPVSLPRVETGTISSRISVTLSEEMVEKIPTGSDGSKGFVGAIENLQARWSEPYSTVRLTPGCTLNRSMSGSPYRR